MTTTPLPSFDQVKALFADTFDLQEYPFTTQTQATVRTQFIDAMRTQGRTTPMFGLALKGRDAYLTLALKAAHRPPASASPRTKLDVSLLQQLVVAKLCPTQQEQEAILYTKDDHEALDWAANGTGTGSVALERHQGERGQGRGHGGRTDAAQVHLLLPQAVDRAS